MTYAEIKLLINNKAKENYQSRIKDNKQGDRVSDWCEAEKYILKTLNEDDRIVYSGCNGINTPENIW
jgi:hypothetical protein